MTPTTPSAPPPTPVAPPPTTVAACSAPASWTQTESRSAICAAGQAGTVTERRTATHSYTCPEAWDAPVQTVSPWSAWTVSSSTCAACPAPSTQTDTQWVGTSSTCPSGQLGTITWEYQQTRSRSLSYNCPAGTTSLPAATLGAWSSWSNTGATRAYSNTCAAACSAPAPSSIAISRSLANETRDAGCPVGQSGQHMQSRTVTEHGTRTTSWTCPGPTSTTSDAWSGSYTYGTWTTTSNTCKSSVTYGWEYDVIRPDYGGTQSDRTQFTVLSVNGMDTLPRSCWASPPAGNLWTWRGGGYFPDFRSNNAGCECNASRVGWEVTWNQSEYFAYDEDRQWVCKAYP